MRTSKRKQRIYRRIVIGGRRKVTRFNVGDRVVTTVEAPLENGEYLPVGSTGVVKLPPDSVDGLMTVQWDDLPYLYPQWTSPAWVEPVRSKRKSLPVTLVS